jgi:hypothetical protein
MFQAQILPIQQPRVNVMPEWKDIARLSDQEEKTREAAFEARMLAMIAQDESQPSTTTSPASAAPVHDGIQVSVTENGQTIHYNDLEAVPWPVRQRIMNAWRPSPTPGVPPLPNASSFRNALPSPSTPRPRTPRFAMFLNLMLPGAGQFYLGQRAMGSVYGLGFIACFATMLAVFLRAYFDYLRLSTSGGIMETGNLEQLVHAFHTGMLMGLTVVSIAIYLVSTIHLAASRPRK